MKTQTIKQPILLYVLFILAATFAFTFDSSAQTIHKDENGNYIAIKTARTDSVNVIETGKTFTTLNGEKLKVYQTKSGKLYVMRQSRRTGNLYKEYLKVD